MVDYIKRLIKGKDKQPAARRPSEAGPGRLTQRPVPPEPVTPDPSAPGAQSEIQAPAIAPITRSVLLVINDPPVPDEDNQRLTQIFRWKDTESLVADFISDIRTVSAGYLNYEIVDRVYDDEFPVKEDGFAYSPDEYVKAFRARTPHDPDRIDYMAQIRKHNLEHRKRMGDFDEVWFMAFPFAGHYESTMAGPGSFWLNSPPVSETDRFPSRFVMMGFSYERGVGEMLESFGHRVESVMEQVYKQPGRSRNLWKRYIQHEKTHPGQANVGTVHFAPNSERDYDWGNTRPVTSYCDDWLTFPTLPGNAKTVTCAEWGDGDIRKHHLWWLDHLPKVPGEIDGVSNNWWEYIAFERTDF